MRMALAKKSAGLAGAILLAMLSARALIAQDAAASEPAQAVASSAALHARPQWEIAAGGTMKFEAATIRRDSSGKFKKPSFALSADDGFPPADGHFHADFPLAVYIQFAYKQWFTQKQMSALLASLPKWVLTDTYEIEARATSSMSKPTGSTTPTSAAPTKDQMRLMLQSLLVERFGLRAHFETRQQPVFLLTLARPGKMGPRLHTHAPDCNVVAQTRDAASKTTPEKATAAKSAAGKSSAAKEIFPPLCLDQALVTIPQPNHVKRTGARNMPMAVLAMYLPTMGDLDRPVVDRTGIASGVDFSLEFTPEAFLPMNTGVEADADTPTVSFQDTLSNQLGLVLVPAKAAVEVLVVDHVERPAED